MVISNNLLDYIHKEGYTISRLANEMPMCRQSLSAKLKGQKEFSLTDMQRLVEIFDFTSEETAYFFDLKVKKP